MESQEQIILPSQQQLPDWQAIFGNAQPLKLEIGPGRGDFLISHAGNELSSNFIGIEIRRKRVEKIKARIERAGLKNALVLMGDAKTVLTSLFAPGSVHTLFIHFPDPWPKRRHEDRRLIQPDIVKVAHTLLSCHGRIYLTTDVESYAGHMSRCFSEHGGFTVIYAESGQRDYPYHRSIHETKFKACGRTIHYFCFEKQKI